jgi:magnesium transporter
MKNPTHSPSIKKPILDLIVTNIPSFNENTTIETVISTLLKNINTYETIDYIYITDNLKHLKGVISIKELLKLEKNKTLNEYTNRKIISARIHTEQERLSMLALKNNLKEIPIIDKEDRLLGVVTYDEILAIMHKEGVDNILKFGGVINSENLFDDISSMPIILSIKHRIPWLILGLIGGLLMAGIINRFEDVLSKNLILASFIPLIVYMSSAVGTQMQSFIIRDLALKPDLKLANYFLKQTTVVMLIGIIISTMIYVITYFTYKSPQLSVVFFIAFVCAITSSLFTGIIIPYLFKKANMDPANASGPIATIIQDTLSVIIYFTIASLILI